MSTSLQGRTIVVTGGFGILGRAVSKLAMEQGARVAILDVAPAPSEHKGPGRGGVDLTDPAATEEAFAEIATQCARVDALLNVAGGFTWQTVAEGDPAQWERMFKLNVKTALTASRAALPYLLKTGGAIVNVGANAALKAGSGMGAYAASKQGVHKLTESMAEELKGKVRVNAVLPSILDTPQNRKDMPNTDPAIWVQPEDLARVMLFLASPEARAVTGALVPVTGQV